MAPRKRGWENLSPATRQRYARYFGGSEAKARRRYDSDKPMNVGRTRRPQLPREAREAAPAGFSPKDARRVIIREGDEGPEYEFVMDDGSRRTIRPDAGAVGPMWRWIRRYDLDHTVDSPGAIKAA